MGIREDAVFLKRQLYSMRQLRTFQSSPSVSSSLDSSACKSVVMRQTQLYLYIMSETFDVVVLLLVVSVL